MGTKWSQLIGDTSVFAVELSFSQDPDEGVAATVEESASWGSFQIWVQGMNLCAHHTDGEELNSVHWYLLPLIEWFADNWDALFHEERLPNRNAASIASVSLENSKEAPPGIALEDWEENWYQWWHRHNLESARFGGVFPSIILRRWRDKTELSWGLLEGSAKTTGLRFNEQSGAARLPSLAVTKSLYAVLTEAVNYLSSLCPQSERLRVLKHSLLAIRSPSEARLAWLLGFGRTTDELRSSCERLRSAVLDMRSEVRESVLGQLVGQELVTPPFAAALMFGSVSPHLEMSDRVCLLRALAEAFQPGHDALINQLAHEVPVDTIEPWKQGYELATELLERLGLGAKDSGAVDVEMILGEQGVTVEQIELRDPSIRAVAIGGAEYKPTVLVNARCHVNQYPSGRRFTLAHEFCHLIYDAAYARDVAIASGDWAPNDIEVRANALAAMLLMPPALLQRAIAQVQGERWSVPMVSKIAHLLETSFTSTSQHLYNLGYFGETQRDALLNQAYDARGNA